MSTAQEESASKDGIAPQKVDSAAPATADVEAVKSNAQGKTTDASKPRTVPELETDEKSPDSLENDSEGEFEDADDTDRPPTPPDDTAKGRVNVPVATRPRPRPR